MSAHAAEDEQVECLQIEEGGHELAAQLHTFDEMEEVVHVQEADDDEDEEDATDEALHLEDLNFNNCSDGLGEEVLTLESIEEESEEVEIHAEEKPKAVAIPPLRPLTIAPKPAKLPVSFKPVAGQQLLLLQGAGAGQQIKLLSAAQGLNLSNLSIAKPISIKQSPKFSLATPKKVVMKKIVQKSLTKTFDGKPAQQIMVLQKSADTPVKLLPAATTKQLTLSEVQQMGLIGGTKIIPHAPKQIVMSKVGQPKAIKIIPQVRPPAKILPAPQLAATASTSTKAQPQRIYLKPANVTNAAAAATATHILPGQIIQVPSGQAGQLHQITIPGKGMQYIKFVTTAQSVESPLTTSPTAAAAVAKVSAAKATAVPASASPTKQIIKVAKPLPAVGNRALTLTSLKAAAPPAALVTPATSTPRASLTPRHAGGDAVVPKIASPDLTMESNGIKTRKPCNCAKSQCLKLYCDCFANGEFCFMCNCMNCYNNIENEEQRQRAIKNCLERNPNAFRPKIGKGKETGEAAIRKHTKGCNCKRSGCLKNYCECYEAKIACSSNCKCMGCMNVESPPLAMASNITETRSSQRSDGSGSGGGGFLNTPPSSKKAPVDTNNKRKSVAKQPSSYINGAVIEATSQCLLSMAKNAEDTAQSEEITKREIIEEFGRCLKQIIECTVNKG